MNTFGSHFRLTSFGESHGPAMGGIIDGCPPRHVISLTTVQRWLDRRAPGRSSLTSARREPDRVEFLSGLMAYDESTEELSALTPDTDKAITLGTPIAFIIRNADSRSADYDPLRHIFRPSHADFAWEQRYGIRDWRGGGRSSGRETISRVVAGAIASQLLAPVHISITSRISSIGTVANPTPAEIEKVIAQTRQNADSIGGTVTCTVFGLKAGIGNPVFGKLDALLASACLSIGAVKGVEFGMGFDGCSRYGSEVADCYTISDKSTPLLTSNNSGGIQGGISNGAPLIIRLAVKPTPSIARPLQALNDSGEVVPLTTRGRHDPCILPRILPVVEAMVAITLLDAILASSPTIPGAVTTC